MTSGTSTRPPTPRRRGEVCFFNGIDAATGDYFVPPLPARRLAGLARREPRCRLPGARGPAAPGPAPGGGGRGVEEGVDARDLGQTGWGVVFAPGVDGAMREALAPLLSWRRAQAGRLREGRYRELEIRPGEQKTDFLARHGAAPGPAVAARLPYYVLLVGGPEEIPFELQYVLDVQYAVGRIAFDTAGEYERYARGVVAAESGGRRPAAEAVFFAPRHAGDEPTRLAAEQLAAPLAATLRAARPDWTVRDVTGEAATKAALAGALAAGRAPALLFTAGHGLCFHRGDSRQLAEQGALVCQDWPGPGHPIEGGHYLGADDVPESASAAGMIAFHFSCFGAGTPRRDGYLEPLFGEREIAPRAFLSRLARRLLAHPRGGAQAVVGHVDRAFSWSFAGDTGSMPTLRPVFESALRRLAAGYPIGYAMEFFNGCYAELAATLEDEAARSPARGDPAGDARLARLWAGRNDARNYAVLGDPAVRLAAATAGDGRRGFREHPGGEPPGGEHPCVFEV